MKISINEPCHENWDKMTPNDKGAFCLSCQKNVVDFSNKSIAQIKDFFIKKTSTDSVCGRFAENQLAALTFDDFFTSFRSWKFIQKVALIVFFVFGLSLFGCAQSQPDTLQAVMGRVAYISKKDTTKRCVKSSVHKAPIKGSVSTTKTKQPKKKDTERPRLMGDVMVDNKQK